MNSFCEQYLELLNTEFKGLNLTRITSEEDFYLKQYLDSVKPIEEIVEIKHSIERAKIVLDVGFGGGFPILPLAEKFPSVKFIGIDARAKKVNAVNLIAKSMNFNNVKCVHCRIEDLLIDTECVVTFKAVGKVENFLPKINSLKNIEAYFYKGPSFEKDENIEAVKENWKVFLKKEVEIAGIDRRIIVGFKNVLRGTKSQSKKLVKLSGLI